MSRLPESDLPEYFPDDVELRLQRPELFEELHAVGERLNFFYSQAHKAIILAAEPSLENDALEYAVTTGVKAYEVIDSYVEPSKPDDGSLARQAVLSGLLAFVNDIKQPDDFLHKLTVAGERLESDAPRLNEVITEVVGYHVRHDPVATRFARQGAAVMRAMHIYLDRRLAA